MKIRTAKKIMKKAMDSPRYVKAIIDNVQILSKERKYWGTRWALYFASEAGAKEARDHRISKAINMTNKRKKRIDLRVAETNASLRGARFNK